MTDSPYVATRCGPEIPMWDIYAHGSRVGCATVFETDGEGTLATVRYGDNLEPVVFQGDSIRGVLEAVGAYLREVDADMKALADAEYFSEVIGPMEAAERLAEDHHIEDDPVW